MSETPEFETVDGRLYLRCYCGHWVPAHNGDDDKTCYLCRTKWRRTLGTWAPVTRTQGDDTEQRP